MEDLKMFMLNKGMQKVIASGIALLMSLTALFVTAWAILSTEKVGLTVNVSFDSAGYRQGLFGN